MIDSRNKLFSLTTKMNKKHQLLILLRHFCFFLCAWDRHSKDFKHALKYSKDCLTYSSLNGESKSKQMDLQFCILLFEVWPDPAAHLIHHFKGSIFIGAKFCSILYLFPLTGLDFAVTVGILKIFEKRVSYWVSLGPFLFNKYAEHLYSWVLNVPCMIMSRIWGNI